MATMDQILAGMIEFRDAVYAQLNSIETKMDNLSLNTFHICTMCQGTGQIVPSHNFENGTPPSIICPSCNGQGDVKNGRATENT